MEEAIHQSLPGKGSLYSQVTENYVQKRKPASLLQHQSQGFSYPAVNMRFGVLDTVAGGAGILLWLEA